MNTDDIEPRDALESLDEAAAAFQGDRQQHRYLEASVDRLAEVIREWDKLREEEDELT